MERQKGSQVKKNQNRIRINGFRKEKDEPDLQHLGVETAALRLHNACHSLNPLSAQFYFSIVIVLETFLAFQFFPIIAEVVTFELDGLYTRYGEGRAVAAPASL